MLKKLSRLSSGNEVLDQYENIRQRYLARSEGGSVIQSPITDRHGVFRAQQNQLTERFAGFDKLFYTLIRGVIDDPDFAVKKDTEIYDKMMRDPQIFYCLFVRKEAVASLPWILRPPAGKERDAKAKGYAEAAEERLHQTPRFSELLENIMDALLPGLSVNELVWKVNDKGRYVIGDHFPINKDRFKFDKNGQLYLLSPRNPTWGEHVPPYKFVAHTFNVTDGSWKKPETAGYVFYGRGLADTPLYHYFYFKMMALKFLMKTLERYGMPFKVFYSGSQNAALADKMDSIMAALKNDAVVGIPGKFGETKVEVSRQAAGQAASNIFMQFINYIDTLITKTILGQELMTEMPGVGSYGAAQVHRSVFGFINAGDRTRLSSTISRTILRYDMQLNAPDVPQEYYPTFEFKKAAVEDTSTFLDTVDLAIDLGLTVSEAQVREFTGLREPLQGEPILQGRQPEPMGMDEPAQPARMNKNGNRNRNKTQGTGANVSKLRRGLFPGDGKGRKDHSMPRVSR